MAGPALRRTNFFRIVTLRPPVPLNDVRRATETRLHVRGPWVGTLLLSLHSFDNLARRGRTSLTPNPGAHPPTGDLGVSISLDQLKAAVAGKLIHCPDVTISPAESRDELDVVVWEAHTNPRVRKWSAVVSRADLKVYVARVENALAGRIPRKGCSVSADVPPDLAYHIISSLRSGLTGALGEALDTEFMQSLPAPARAIFADNLVNVAGATSFELPPKAKELLTRWTAEGGTAPSYLDDLRKLPPIGQEDGYTSAAAPPHGRGQ